MLSIEISSISSEYLKKINEKETEFYKSYNSLEKQVKEALKKKAISLLNSD